MFAFEMSVEVAQEFYRRAQELGALTEEQKVHILLQMVEEGLIQNVVSTSMSKDQFVQVLSQHFKVLDVRENSNEAETKDETNDGQIGTAGN